MRIEHRAMIMGVLFTFYKTRNNLSKRVLQAIHEIFGDKVFETKIPENIKLNEIPNKLDKHPDTLLSTFPLNQENIHSATHIPNKMGNQSNKNLRPCKMTFNLSEELYKAFNDLYAARILQGKKTEKSEILCEAIRLLLKEEEKAPSHSSQT